VILKEYNVIDRDGAISGTLKWTLCEGYASLNEVIGFSRLEQSAQWLEHPCPAKCGFVHFKQQLPIAEIYPVAVLNDIEIDRPKQGRGLGTEALRSFRVLVQHYGARLGWLMIGAQGDEIEEGTRWRIHFYEKDSWVCFKSPDIVDIVGISRVWMYHLLPPLLPAEPATRMCLIEKPVEDNFYGWPQPKPCGE
jgi:hypothetical protein